jgi:hypothetical protein
VNQQAPGLFRVNRKRPGKQPVQDWTSLQPGDCVEVWSIDSFLYAAHVDDSAHDGQMIWIIENGTGCRRLFVRGDPVKLYSFEGTVQR